MPLKVRRKNSSKKVKENKRVLGRSIDERPNFIDNRNVFGHLISTRWSNTKGGFYEVKLLREIDTVIGRKNKTDKVLLTLLERKTRYLITMDLNDKIEVSVIDAISKLKKLYGNKFNKVLRLLQVKRAQSFLLQVL